MTTNNFSYFTEQSEIVKASFVSIHNHHKFNFTISTPSFWVDTLVSITVLLSSRFANNYGTIGLLDWLHGTDKEFKSSLAYKRHFVVWGLTPASETVQSRDKQQNGSCAD